MNNQKKNIGVLIAIIGIASIIISQTANFTYTKEVIIHNNLGIGLQDMTTTESFYNKDLQSGFLYGGIVILIIGAGIALFTDSEQDKK